MKLFYDFVSYLFILTLHCRYFYFIPSRRFTQFLKKSREKYPLLKDTLNYTEFFSEAMVFNDIVAVYEYIERHGLEKLATVIKA